MKLRCDHRHWDRWLPGISISTMIPCLCIWTRILFFNGQKYLAVLLYWYIWYVYQPHHPHTALKYHLLTLQLESTWKYSRGSQFHSQLRCSSITLFLVLNVAIFITLVYLDKRFVILGHIFLQSQTNWENIPYVAGDYNPFPLFMY